MNKLLKSILLYIGISIFATSCEAAIEYVDVIITETITEEVIVTETITEEVEVIVTEYVEVIVIEYVDREVIVTEYIDNEVVITKYIEVDKIIEVITEVEVETIVIEEKIIEVEVVEYVEIPVAVIVTETVTEYVDRIETVTEYVDKVVTVIEYVEVETIVNNDIIVDNVINTETIIYVEKEIYIMAEPEIIIDPIKEYSNYVTRENKVLGVIDGGFEEIPLISGLFVIDGTLFFTIDEKFYSQSSGIVKEIDTADFPEVPPSEYIAFESGPYKIQESVYNDDPISKVYNGFPNVGYMQIDGACLRGNDLLYSVSIGITGREVGVYLWTVNGNPLLVMEDGRIW